jgi:hypothetical protein
MSKLENQLRDALRERAASTPIGDHSFADVRTIDERQSSRRRPRRRYVVATGAVAAAAALVVALAHDGPTTDVGTETTPAAPSGPTVPGLPDAEVPRLLIEGAIFQLSEGEGASPVRVDTAKVLQAFRRAGQLDGPMIFVTTLRPYNPATFGLLDDDTGDPIDVRGQVGYIGHLNGEQGATTLSVELGDGNAIYVTDIGLTDDELVSFVNGLNPGPNGGWVDTVAPQGLSEVTVAPPPADGRYYGGQFELPGVASVDVNLYQDGFESRLDDRVSSTVQPVEQVSIDGLPATVGAYDDTDWWVLLEPEPGRALELRIAGDRPAVARVLSQARFVDEGTWDAATNIP